MGNNSLQIKETAGYLMQIEIIDKTGKKYIFNNPADFSRFFGIAWTDEITYQPIDGGPQEKFFFPIPEQQPNLNQTDTTPKYCIKYINDMVGDIVITLQKIAQGEIIALYSGELCNTDRHSTGYMLILPTPKKLAVDAGRQGNFSRFMAHLPTKEELKDYDFTRDVKILAKVATANIKFNNHQFQMANGMFFSGVLLEAQRAIGAGEILGFSYDWDYWQARGLNPVLFDKYGAIIRTGYKTPTLIK